MSFGFIDMPRQQHFRYLFPFREISLYEFRPLSQAISPPRGLGQETTTEWEDIICQLCIEEQTSSKTKVGKPKVTLGNQHKTHFEEIKVMFKAWNVGTGQRSMAPAHMSDEIGKKKKHYREKRLKTMAAATPVASKAPPMVTACRAAFII